LPFISERCFLFYPFWFECELGCAQGGPQRPPPTALFEGYVLPPFPTYFSAFSRSIFFSMFAAPLPFVCGIPRAPLTPWPSSVDYLSSFRGFLLSVLEGNRLLEVLCLFIFFFCPCFPCRPELGSESLQQPVLGFFKWMAKRPAAGGFADRYFFVNFFPSESFFLP